MKRLIEVALPIREISLDSGSEKRQISAAHVWWARRPLSACRAVVFAALIPDPDDNDCPAEFRTLVNDLLNRPEFAPKDVNGNPIYDSPRNRCLEFIKHLVKWEHSNNPTYTSRATKLICAANHFLMPDDVDRPVVLDPFSGGGAIPLEALRLGCDVQAIDLNPVAHVLEMATLVYPQQFGSADSRPVPEYIRRAAAHCRNTRKKHGQGDLFSRKAEPSIEDDDLLPDVAISDSEYLANPLAADVSYWGHWVIKSLKSRLHRFYPENNDTTIAVVYLWARTIKCSNPSCAATIPLIRQLWLCNKPKRKVALKMQLMDDSCQFSVVEDGAIDFDPTIGTVQQANAMCPFCSQVSKSDYLRKECIAGRMKHQLLAVVTTGPEGGKEFRQAQVGDDEAFRNAAEQLSKWQSASEGIVPTEPISQQQPRVMWVTLYGLTKWGDLFNDRQLLTLASLVECVKEATALIAEQHDAEYARAVATYLAFLVDKHADYNCSLSSWHCNNTQVRNVFSRQALPMVWDYCEANPFSGSSGSVSGALKDILRYPPLQSPIQEHGCPSVSQGSATRLGLPDGSVAAVVTDPPYYDAIPYADLSDFFYVWLKRSIGHLYEDVFRTPVTPKVHELIEERPHSSLKKRKDKEYYERGMAEAASEMQRVLAGSGIACIMFAHKTTTAWETLISGLIKSSFVVTASWPLHTEMKSRMIARGTAALASTVTLVCRKRTEDAGDGLWDDVRQELKTVAKERLDFFWDQGIRGADFFISAIGPALSVFGRYAQVIRISGEEVTVGEFLDEVRTLVTNYALTKILHTTNTANIDPESRFYVVWKWSYGDGKVPADESFKLAQALGIDTEEMWDKTGVLERSGENVQAMPIAKRMKIKNLGEPEADGTLSSLIDVLHRMCVFRDKGDNAGMAQFLGRSGQARNSALWLIAQAVSEILPDGEREKQLMQGLLNQQEGLEEATRQGELF